MLVVRLSTKLDLVCEPAAVSDDDTLEPTAAYAHSLLRTLADAFTKKAALSHVDIVKYLDRLVPRLFSLHICAALAEPGDNAVASHPRIVAVSAEVMTIVVQAAAAQYVTHSSCTPPLTVSCRRQETFLAVLFPAYFDNDVSRLAGGQQKVPGHIKFYPFGVSMIPSWPSCIPLNSVIGRRAKYTKESCRAFQRGDRGFA